MVIIPVEHIVGAQLNRWKLPGRIRSPEWLLHSRIPPPQSHEGPSTPSLLSALHWAPEAKIGADFPSGGLLRFSQDGQCPRLPEEAPWGLAHIQSHAAVSGGLRSQGPEGSELVLAPHSLPLQSRQMGFRLSPSSQPTSPAIDRMGWGGGDRRRVSSSSPKGEGAGSHSSSPDCSPSAPSVPAPPRFLVFLCVNRGQPVPPHLRRSCLFPSS